MLGGEEAMLVPLAVGKCCVLVMAVMVLPMIDDGGAVSGEREC
jgi:hypothetical protein